MALFKQKTFILSVLTLSLVILLSGCGEKSGRVYYQKIDQTMKLDIRMTYDFKGDTILKQTSNNIIAYSSLGVTSAKEAKDILGSSAQAYQGIEGIKEELDYKEDRVEEILDIDYEKVDFDKLSTLPGMFFQEDTINSKKVSLDKTGKFLENNGFTEVKDGKFEDLR